MIMESLPCLKFIAKCIMFKHIDFNTNNDVNMIMNGLPHEAYSLKVD